MNKNITITLTAREADALLQGLYISTASYDGWSAEEKGNDTIQDIKAWDRIEKKIYEAGN